MVDEAKPALRCALFARVAVTDQERAEGGLDAQDRRCRRYAADRGWEVVDARREVAAGLDPKDRPQLAAALAAVRGGRADVLLCDAPHRLARRPEQLRAVVDECAGAGACLAFASDDDAVFAVVLADRLARVDGEVRR